MLIKNGTIHDAVNREAYRADILIKGGKIAKIAPDLDAVDEAIFDANGLFVYPGFVEAHGHSGLDGYGIGYEGQDYNEMNDALSPQLRAIDAIEPADPALREAREAGVTTLCIGPGSANVLGGTFCAFKPYGNRIDSMWIVPEVAMKCAFGENPKRCYREKGISTRMSTAAKLRETLFRAKEYLDKIERAKGDSEKLPAFDMKLNAMLPVLRGEMPLKAHAHQADDVLTAIRIAKEFGVGLTLEHCTEGRLIANILAEENLPIAVGPTFGHATKFELRNKSWDTPGVLSRAGCMVSIITDSPVIEQKHLTLCAALAIKSGMDPFEALKAITINPARHIGVDSRVGSLEENKDADLVILNGSPFELQTEVVQVLIDGLEMIERR